MNARHALVGYYRDTDGMVARHWLPEDRLSEVKAIAEVDEDDPEATESYVLTWQQAKRIAAIAGVSLIDDGLDYFQESFAPADETDCLVVARRRPSSPVLTLTAL